MTQKTILHVFPTFGLGGQQRRFAELVDQLTSDFHHRVISLSPDVEAQNLIQKKQKISVSTLDLDKSALTNFSNIKKLKRLFSDCDPDLLCTYNWGAIEAVIAKQAGSLRKIGHLHFEDGFGPDEGPTRQNKKRVLARRAVLRNTKIIVPSRTLEILALETWKLQRKNILRIPNGIDVERFTVGERDYNHGGPVTIGTVGAFRPEKNLKLLIDLFSRQRADSAAKLLLVGDGPQMSMLKEASERSEKAATISLPGATNTPEKNYKNFDIFALTSTTEQMPIGLIEAMIAGLPIIATDVGDVRDMVASENVPFIGAIEDEDGLRGNLEKLLDNPDLRASIGFANRKKALHDFDRVAMIETYENLFREHSGLV